MKSSIDALALCPNVMLLNYLLFFVLSFFINFRCMNANCMFCCILLANEWKSYIEPLCCDWMFSLISHDNQWYRSHHHHHFQPIREEEMFWRRFENWDLPLANTHFKKDPACTLFLSWSKKSILFNREYLDSGMITLT